MTTEQIANRLVELCKAKQDSKAVDELYSDDIVSIEAKAGPGMPAEMRGIDAIRKKHDWWYANVTVHDGSTEGPFLHGDDQFAVIFAMDITMKDSGKRMNLREVAVYTVAGGKIAKERFFSSPC